ncbi:hypothetical protein FACS1894111_07190 [Clostridia bacterium]|nr:hypothetical protein FACS1894111_07190 [Clostridia bacterium]
MKRKSYSLSIIMTLMGVLFCMPLLSACSSRDPQALTDELAYRQLGLNKMEQGDYGGAAEAFSDALDESLAIIEPLELDICYYKAKVQELSGDIQGAYDTYQNLISYNKKDYKAYYLRGCLHLRQGEQEEAKADLLAAIKVNKTDRSLATNVAERLSSMGMQSDANDILRQAIKGGGTSPADLRQIGYAYYLLGEYELARQSLDKAAGQGDTTAILYLAKTYEAEGNTEQYEKQYQTYLANHDGDTVALNGMALAKIETGEYEEALSLIQTALAKEQPDNLQELKRNEIAILEYTLDFAGAREKMESYLKDYPGDKEAAKEYEFLKTR